ncbi:hypothetical protein KW790_00035 [Candidatus Parcubacteria bacterium]|nr:hypothetical protein [Candidatus Parcubacteria bacterium]
MSFENQPDENIESLKAYLGKLGLDIEQIYSGDSLDIMNIRGSIYRWIGEDETKQATGRPYLEAIEHRLNSIETNQRQQFSEQVETNKSELEKYGGPLNWITQSLGIDKEYLKHAYSQRRLDDPVAQAGITNEARILLRKFGEKKGLTSLELSMDNSSRFGFELDQLVGEIKDYVSS